MIDVDLADLLADRVRGRYSAVLAGRHDRIALRTPEGRTWWLLLDDGRVHTGARGDGRAATTITAPEPVLRQVVSGQRSGTAAFLDGELTVRGSLALALQMDGLFVGADAPMDRTHSRVVEAAGIDTSYLESGPPDAPTVVLVHGLGATNASLLPLVVRLARNHHVIAPDLPGHGATAAARDDYSASFLGRWLVDLMGQLGVDEQHPAVLVGNSLGGRTALEAALISPELVSGLIGLCPAVAFRKLRQFVPVVRLLRPGISALPVRIPRRAAEGGLRAMFADSSRLPAAWYDAAIDEFMRVMGTRGGRVAFFSALRQIYLDAPFGEDGFWHRLPALRAPALFVWGDCDVLVPHGFARHVSAALPAAQTVVFESCGHVPQFEWPDRTAQLVEDFLAGRAAPVRREQTS